MKKRTKHFIIDHGTYPFDVLFCVSLTRDEVLKQLKKLGYEPTEKELEALNFDGEGRTVMLEGGQTILWVKNQTPSHIAHEVFHAVEFLFNRIDLPHDIEHGEAWAYQIQHLTKQIYQKL